MLKLELSALGVARFTVDACGSDHYFSPRLRKQTYGDKTEDFRLPAAKDYSKQHGQSSSDVAQPMQLHDSTRPRRVMHGFCGFERIFE